MIILSSNTEEARLPETHTYGLGVCASGSMLTLLFVYMPEYPRNLLFYHLSEAGVWAWLWHKFSTIRSLHFFLLGNTTIMVKHQVMSSIWQFPTYCSHNSSFYKVSSLHVGSSLMSHSFLWDITLIILGSEVRTPQLSFRKTLGHTV